MKHIFERTVDFNELFHERDGFLPHLISLFSVHDNEDVSSVAEYILVHKEREGLISLFDIQSLFKMIHASNLQVFIESFFSIFSLTLLSLYSYIYIYIYMCILPSYMYTA